MINFALCVLFLVSCLTTGYAETMYKCLKVSTVEKDGSIVLSDKRTVTLANVVFRENQPQILRIIELAVMDKNVIFVPVDTPDGLIGNIFILNPDSALINGLDTYNLQRGFTNVRCNNRVIKVVGYSLKRILYALEKSSNPNVGTMQVDATVQK